MSDCINVLLSRSVVCSQCARVQACLCTRPPYKKKLQAGVGMTSIMFHGDVIDEHGFACVWSFIDVRGGVGSMQSSNNKTTKSKGLKSVAKCPCSISGTYF